MQGKNPLEFADAFNAFSRSLKQGSGDQASPPASHTAGESPAHHAEADQTVSVLRAMQVLRDRPGGEMSFSEFSNSISGNSVATLGVAIDLMQRGWIEFAGEISESSAVRITPEGKLSCDIARGAVRSA